ncbi:hypothetical protein Sango_0454300 [Sesamum angolense]|uniref:HotDog ACOT-type domain-containing protein n=1 Tax=Sesamum angolense TaxID=2727404 RepID=A0AAE1XC62_9LAMI|nr:hypothetical protein Sango_0454300 [Sesamum angolense]
MHRAFELAFSTAYTFAGMMPSFLEVDHVDFLRPVDVGDFLRFKSCVLYTECEGSDRPLIHVEVVAHVTRPELRTAMILSSRNGIPRTLKDLFVLLFSHENLSLPGELDELNRKYGDECETTNQNEKCQLPLQVSNRFYFTFTVRPEAKAMNNSHRIRKVVPATAEEAHRIIERMDADSL